MDVRITSFLYVMLASSSCATSAGYRQLVAQWVGKNSDERIAMWGPPDREALLSNGERVLSYRRNDVRVTATADRAPWYGEGGLYGFDRISESLSSIVCRTHYTVNETNTIERVEFRGRGCRATRNATSADPSIIAQGP